MELIDLAGVALGGLIGVVGTVVATKLEHLHADRREELARYERVFQRIVEAMQDFEDAPVERTYNLMRQAIGGIYLLPRTEVFDHIKPYLAAAMNWSKAIPESADWRDKYGEVGRTASAVVAAISRALCDIRNGKQPKGKYVGADAVIE